MRKAGPGLQDPTHYGLPSIGDDLELFPRLPALPADFRSRRATPDDPAAWSRASSASDCKFTIRPGSWQDLEESDALAKETAYVPPISEGEAQCEDQ